MARGFGEGGQVLSLFYLGLDQAAQFLLGLKVHINIHSSLFFINSLFDSKLSLSPGNLSCYNERLIHPEFKLFYSKWFHTTLMLCRVLPLQNCILFENLSFKLLAVW